MYKEFQVKGRITELPEGTTAEQLFCTFTSGIASATGWSWAGHVDRETGKFSFDTEADPPEITLEQWEGFLRRILAENSLPMETHTQMAVDGYYMNPDGTRGEPVPGLFNASIRQELEQGQE